MLETEAEVSRDMKRMNDHFTKGTMNRTTSRQPIASLLSERGQGLVEFALILPLLLALLLAIIDFGRLFFIYSEVSSAVREAIRYSAVNPYDCALIRQHAASTLTLTDVDAIDLTISFDDGLTTKWTYSDDCGDEPPDGTVAIGDRITIRASARVSMLTADIIGPVVKQSFGALPIEYVSSRTILPAEGIETGPTSTPLPTRTPPPGASHTPTHTPSPTPTHTPVPPQPPIIFIAAIQCQNKRVDFSWEPVSDATSYRVYRADTGALIEETTSTRCNNCDDLGSSQTRTYYAVAVNAGGESGPSSLSTVTCGAGATDTPTPTAVSRRDSTTTPISRS